MCISQLFSEITSIVKRHCYSAWRKKSHFPARRWDHWVQTTLHFRLRFSPCTLAPTENGNMCLVPKTALVKLHYDWDDIRLLKGTGYIWDSGRRNIRVKVFLHRWDAIAIQVREAKCGTRGWPRHWPHHSGQPTIHCPSSLSCTCMGRRKETTGAKWSHFC